MTTQSRQINCGCEDRQLAGVGLTAGTSISKIPGKSNELTTSDPEDNRCQGNGGRLTPTLYGGEGATATAEGRWSMFGGG